MTSNIYWADPEVKVVWSYDGRLYRSYRKAELERNAEINYAQMNYDHWLKRIESGEGHKYSQEPEYYLEAAKKRLENPKPIYRIQWAWEEVTDGV